MKNSKMAAFLIVGLLFLSCGGQAAGDVFGMTMARQYISLNGAASGGVLTLNKPSAPNGRFISITTSPGESAKSVAKRLAAAISQSPDFAKKTGFGGLENSSLVFPGFQNSGSVAFGGTETGLGIPQPPLSLSASIDSSKGHVILDWVNPPGGYDAIAVACCGDTRGYLPGNATTHVDKRILKSIIHDIDHLNFCVVGYKDNVPSNAGLIRVTRCGQEELCSAPFTINIAPNWAAWSKNTGTGEISFVQGEKTFPGGETPSFFRNPEKKAFYQILSGSGENYKGGILRKFLGLTPGHTYRVAARINTLESGQGSENWSLSFHGAHNAPDGADLTDEQLAGLAPLPDGTSGPEAGQLARFSAAKNTAARWLKCSTDGLGPGKKIGNITLPEGVNTITIWMRLSGSGPTEVAMDWVALEDISCAKNLQ